MEVLLESILSRKNLTIAYNQVVGNKGAAGIDGMKVDELGAYLKSNWEDIREQIHSGKYRPSAVRRVSIPKPNGGERHLGIPTVLDRMIQHSISQELDKYYDGQFSEMSYGFRKGRNAHQALEQSLNYIKTGREYIVSIDLEKFFDRVNHDKLMSKLSKSVSDKEVLRLIRRYLQSGVMDEGVVKRNEEGTPQGGNLSPVSLDYRLEKVRQVIQGWINYYGLASMKMKMLALDEWLRRRLRMCIWKTWKRVRTRVRSLTKLGIPKEKAYMWGNTRKGYWEVAGSPILQTAITNSRLKQRGYREVLSYYLYRHSNLMNRRDTRTVRPVV